MKEDIKTFVPAAGLATRLGYQSFQYLYDKSTLLGFHIDNLKIKK